jgi:3-hydroxyacyl-[acyl-carrier-protein] dehydratase
VLSSDELVQFTRRLRRGPLLPEGRGTNVHLDRAALERLLPHRQSMLLVDTMDAVDLGESIARGSRTLEAGDIGFDGHFPGEPVYPGALVVESIGQMAVALLHFSESGTLIVPEQPAQRRLRGTHIHHATFLAPFYPGDVMTLHGHVTAHGLTMLACGQAYRGDTLAAYAITEFYVDE